MAEKGILKIDFEKHIPDVLSGVAKGYVKNLNRIFSAKEDAFSGTSIRIKIKNNAIDYSDSRERAFFSGDKEVIRLKKEGSFLEISILTSARKDILTSSFIKDMVSRAVAKICFGKGFHRPFVITSERTGISLSQVSHP